MSDGPQPEDVVSELVTALHFQVGEAERAYGEVRGSPVAMTLIGGDPLALLLAFKIVAPHPAAIDLGGELADFVEEGRGSVSLEDGIAWLSLDDLEGQSSDSVRQLIEGFGDALVAAGVIYPPGCVVCGGEEDVHLLFHDGRCSRLCLPCAEGLYQEKESAEQRSNRPSVFFAMSLPLAFLYVGVGWLTFYSILDALLRWWNTDRIVLPGRLGMLLAMIVLGAIGFGLGYPIGVFLRRSGVSRRLALAASLVSVVLAAAVGELLYVCVIIYRQTGVFDLALGTRVLLPFVRGYPPSWIVGKVLVVGAIALGCYVATTQKKTVKLEL